MVRNSTTEPGSKLNAPKLNNHKIQTHRDDRLHDYIYEYKRSELLIESEAREGGCESRSGFYIYIDRSSRRILLFFATCTYGAFFGGDFFCESRSGFYIYI